MTLLITPATQTVRTSTVPSAMRLLWGIGTAEWTVGRGPDGDVDGTIYGPYQNLIASSVPAAYVRAIGDLPRSILSALDHAGQPTAALHDTLLGHGNHSDPRPIMEIRHILDHCGNLPWSIAGDITLSGTGHVLGADGHLDVVDTDNNLVAVVDVETLAGVGNARLIAEGPAVLAALLRLVTGY